MPQLLRDGPGPAGHRAAGVQGGLGLEEQEEAFLLGHGLVADAFGDDEQLPGAEFDGAGLQVEATGFMRAPGRRASVRS